MKPQKSNLWRIWRPVYKYTWAKWQRQSYIHFANILNNSDSEIVLDIGTGTGEYIELLENHTRRKFIFSDPDAKSLNIAEYRAQMRGLNASYIVGDAFEVLSKVDDCSILSMLHVLSVLEQPFDFVDRAVKKYGEQIKIYAYLSRFNETHLSTDQDLRLGFARLRADELRKRFRVNRISSTVNLYCRTAEE